MWSRPTHFACERAVYTVRTISYYPLIQHIENFITPKEIEHLKQVAEARYTRSTIGVGVSDTRNSSTAYIPADDPIGICIQARAAEFQGYMNLKLMETLQLTKYTKDQLFLDHYDFKHNDEISPGTYNRETTFFGILEATCEECGTRFPRIQANWTHEDPRWCRIVDCDAADLVVKPTPGSATFWVNLLPDGTGNEDLLHGGLPPQAESGKKIGLNIWTLKLV
ncbi:hypothetical protein COCC4DRAFT_154660 [Bipolaris maydis ATCC 48331]|uniref:Prolyl 4-hydroxylase alpha subunit domain-containing protein n=2 Tax=Cochliobolus heterostrophus TaxID=5016 RepID=M2SHS1_COCH5|nr:uncharacterized protein COCC4DRAFT_154660 [Bipolaris maydis ATCC 48331]EMD84930.1 hypothetical protein COCHEDRAFT_1120608 [Bipolaris maydis C5]KAJ5025772.1 hypothetical protein J3E73DRAFT_191465 [Bipolaris maydis]ENH98857.1 hypothetical protein COCC4DRAFT_154660 [Bipolaris maydis ATCC 48331]KAJ5064385.1 2OG-Fe(II) oxygenase [Bipolaris maydis]KAJ6196471.1 2OG-Fe(II) oxygenase [Bipolaris maydis]